MTGGSSRDGIEEAVARAFAEVLGDPGIPRDEPFSSLGGSSLDAALVCSRLGTRLGRPVPVSLMRLHPTVRALAAQLSALPPGVEPERGTAEPASQGGPVPLTAAQSAFLMRHMFAPEDFADHCAGAWTVRGPLDLEALQSSVNDVHHRHEALGCAYGYEGGPVARPASAPPPALRVLPAAPDEEAAVEAARAALSEPFGLEAGHVWRVTVTRLGDAPDHCLVAVAVHHIAFDGASWALLAADLSTAYGARIRGRAPHWSPLPSFHAQTCAHGDIARVADLGRQRDYWRTALDGVPTLRYPQRPDGAAGVGRHETALTAVEFTALRRLAAGAGVFALLLEHYATALGALTGQPDFGIGVPVSRRGDGRLAEVVGCHMDTVCVRARPPRSWAQEAEAALSAQDVPFREVVGLVNPPRSSRTPLYQNILVLQEHAAPELRIAGAATRYLRQPALGLAVELVTEIVPLSGAGAAVLVSHRTDAVPAAFAESLSRSLTDALRASAARAAHPRTATPRKDHPA